MKLLILFAAVVAITTAQTTELDSGASISAKTRYSDSVLVTLLKMKIKCMNNQLETCENLLTSATRACPTCKQYFQHNTDYHYLSHSLYTAVFKDCKDAYENGKRESGIYHLNPDGNGLFSAYCDMQVDGGGWTVIQRRRDGSVNFYRNWKDYVMGFGNLNGEHWLGLEKIHRLTKVASVLRVDMTGYTKGHRYARYNIFKVGSSTTSYTLTTGTYSGNAGNSLQYHNGMKFSTKDKDNDRNGGSCGVSYRGGWWYNSCAHSNLNGIYAGSRRSSTQYCAWYHFDNWYSLKSADMKVRRQ